MGYARFPVATELPKPMPDPDNAPSMDSRLAHFRQRGWVRFPHDRALTAWVDIARPYARAAVQDEQNAEWWRCAATWFVGVNALPNDTTGNIGASGPLPGPAVHFIRHLGLGDFTWDRGQISVMYPGYPKQGIGESAAAHGFRQRYDSAHVDGLHATGPTRRRFLNEYHGFILGIPLVKSTPGAAPVVVWEGSHRLVQALLLEKLGNLNRRDRGNLDLTDCYHEARRAIIQQCQRVEIQAQPGESYLIHRHALHGVAPWQPTATASRDGRMICYFRPELRDRELWLRA